MLVILHTVLGVEDQADLGNLISDLSELKHIVETRLTLSYLLWSREFSNYGAVKQTNTF